MFRLLLSLVLTLSLAGPAMAGELAGVTMPDSVTVGANSLVLNGMGLRKKAFIKVYVAGLYLTQKMKGTPAIIASDTDRRMVMHFVRNVGKGKICNAWNEGLEKNTTEPSAELKAKFETLCTYMEDVSSGDEYVFTYIPGTGTQVEVKGNSKGTIAGKDFADALWRCWIGRDPPGEAFKAGLVGG